MGPIAVFDSGVGGLRVLRELVAQMPSEHFLYFGDSANAPYGTRPTAEIRSLTLAHAERLFDRGAKALVVACNTATSAAIGALRARWPDRVIIGIEPALKLAVSRHPGGCIGVLATEATLREEKFAALLQRCAENCHILAPTFPSPPEPSAVWWGRTSSCWTAARARRARQSAACWTRGCWCSRARAA